MSHHHHDHDSHPQSGQSLSFNEKGEKLLHHWMHHNEEHAQSYRQWAVEFRHHELEGAAALLDRAFELSQKINDALKEASILLKSRGD